MNILGISCFYHDGAACLLRDGEIVAAAEEERFTRKKHDPDFPINAIEFCLKDAGISSGQIDYVGFYEKPFIKFERLLYTYIDTFPKSLVSFNKSMPVWLKQKLWIPNIINEKLNYKGPIVFIEHHLSHAASAFFTSGFEESAILTMDAIGEWGAITLGVGRGNDIEILYEMRFPHSLGMLYSAFTAYLGFEVNDGEYKVMGLAPYGKPIYYDIIMEKLVDLKEDGSFRLNMDYFAYDYGLKMTNNRFNKLFGGPPRMQDTKLQQKHMDIAASIQKATEEIIMKMVNHLYKLTKMKNLCLAGGVALNCVANGLILRESPFNALFIQPASGDSGGSVGVAHFIYNSILGKPKSKSWQTAYLGPSYTNQQIKDSLIKSNVEFQEYSSQDLIKQVARLLTEQKIIGWFQGRMEFGPRALGARSILADARNKDNRGIVNEKIKRREAFRPFAPTVLLDKSSEYFDLDVPSPFMLLVANVKENKRVIPSVTHVDGSARIQTISREQNPLYYDLIKEFYHLTGVPVVLNTSFNIRGEPIVCSPDDAYRCFLATDMDYLVMGNYFIKK